MVRHPSKTRTHRPHSIGMPLSKVDARMIWGGSNRLATLRPVLPSPNLRYFGQVWLDVGPCWPDLGRVREIASNSGRTSPNTCHLRPSSVGRGRFGCGTALADNTSLAPMSLACLHSCPHLPIAARAEKEQTSQPPPARLFGGNASHHSDKAPQTIQPHHTLLRELASSGSLRLWTDLVMAVGVPSMYVRQSTDFDIVSMSSLLP